MNRNKISIQVKKMLIHQNELNTIINPDWKIADYNWLRAAWVECAELMEHVNYKWWKKQTPNINQAHIECADILFFILSHFIILENDATGKITDGIINGERIYKLNTVSTLELIEELTLSLLENDGKYPELFGGVCAKLGLTFDNLFTIYISKLVLNIFRQNNGYKEGTYIKQWPSILYPNDTIEDNVYLEMFLAESETKHMFDYEPEDVFDYLYSKLTDAYPG